MRFAYLYLMKDAPDRVRAVAPEHADYWHGLALRGYLGGPGGVRSIDVWLDDDTLSSSMSTPRKVRAAYS